MTEFEVPQPIICSPFDEQDKHWRLDEGEAPTKPEPGRRAAHYFYRLAGGEADEGAPTGTLIELKLVNHVRARVKAWRLAGWPGVTATTLELLRYWRRDGRQFRPFFAQHEAVETIIFLAEARRDFLQGIDIPLDEPSDQQKGDLGYKAFRRYACKMATGSGKTTVMGMVTAWSILNKVHNRGDRRFSDVVLVVCPNVTIRSRLAELDPKRGAASLYAKADIVPHHLMADLSQGDVLVTNWHVFEQVVGRGLRRRNYESGQDGLMTEEVATVFGVPFQVIPFKANPKAAPKATPRRHHVHALPGRAHLAITFPRVEGYRQAVRSRITIDWSAVPPLFLDPLRIPPEVEVKATLQTNQGRPTLRGPGALLRVDLNPFRRDRRIQELVFDMARDLTVEYVKGGSCEAPAHVLFPQLARIIDRYVHDKVTPVPPAERVDLFLSPYYGWAIERISAAIRPDTNQGESAEVPRYEQSRGPGSTADVDYWTSRDVREVTRSHLNYVVADTAQWEQQAAYILDTHTAVEAFAKNAGLGFAIPYLHNSQSHDYVPDFVVRLRGAAGPHLIIETKGFDDLADVKAAAADRWVKAVNADGQFGRWRYEMARSVAKVREILDAIHASPTP